MKLKHYKNSKELINDLLIIIRDLTDEDDCDYDIHGHCQAHHWHECSISCPHSRAKKIMIELEDY